MSTLFAPVKSAAFFPPPERGRVGWGSADSPPRCRMWRATPSPPSPFQGEGDLGRREVLKEVH
jgi:hypothetical protein